MKSVGCIQINIILHTRKYVGKKNIKKHSNIVSDSFERRYDAHSNSK